MTADLLEFVDVVNTTMVDEIEALNNTNPDAKQEFMNDPTLPRPRNEYANMDGAKAESNLQAIDEALRSPRFMKLSSQQRQLVELLLNDNRLKNQTILYAYQYRCFSGSDKKTAADGFAKATEQLYGTPDEETFLQILNEELSAIDCTSRASKCKLERFFDLTGPVMPMSTKLYCPAEDTLDKLSVFAAQFYRKYLDEIPTDQSIFTVQDVCDIANAILEKMVGAGQTKWHAVVEPYYTYASVNHFEKQIKFPGRRSAGDYSQDDVRAILVHELGTHVLRAFPFENCEVEALSHGFPGNAPIDEGIAKVMECAINHRYVVPGRLHYLSIGFANFLHMNFREVYNAQVVLGELTGHASASRCFDSVQRAFRGTGVLPNNKDLVYYDGAIRIWRYVEQHIDHPDILEDMFTCGKINFFDPLQRELSAAIRSGSL